MKTSNRYYYKRKHKTVDSFSKELKGSSLVLRVYPDPMLHYVSDRVEAFDKELNLFAEEMLSFMIANRGIGLAAPQVGILRRIIISYIDKKPICLVNPEIISEFGTDSMEESCLSIPGEYFNVVRSYRLEIRARTALGKLQRFWAEGLSARIIQHEVDHLNGILICDCGARIPLEKLLHKKNIT